MIAGPPKNHLHVYPVLHPPALYPTLVSTALLQHLNNTTTNNNNNNNDDDDNDNDNDNDNFNISALWNL